MASPYKSTWKHEVIESVYPLRRAASQCAHYCTNLGDLYRGLAEATNNWKNAENHARDEDEEDCNQE